MTHDLKHDFMKHFDSVYKIFYFSYSRRFSFPFTEGGAIASIPSAWVVLSQISRPRLNDALFRTTVGVRSLSWKICAQCPIGFLSALMLGPLLSQFSLLRIVASCAAHLASTAMPTGTLVLKLVRPTSQQSDKFLLLHQHPRCNP